MSNVEDIYKVDAISVDKETSAVVLNIFDHLDWNDETTHVSVLEEKVKNYLKFIESKEIEQVYPDAKGKKIKICIIAKYTLTGNGLKFIASLTKTVNDAGFTLDHSFLKKLKTEGT